MSENDLNIVETLESGHIQQEGQVIVITDPATDRYNTFGFISWWKQDIVRNASIMVIGAGALGNEVLKNLALMGVGKILVVDFDTIENSNLSRSVLFRAADRDHSKAEAAAKAIRDLNPDVKVQWLHVDINHQLGLGVYRRMNVIIGCLDNREARLTINKNCWHLNKPWIDGAIQELLGLARVFRPHAGACYECTLTDEDYRIINVRMSCYHLAHENVIAGKVPTTPTISSIIGAVQTQEALKLLHNMEVKSGKALVFNGLTNDIYFMEYPEKADCQSHWIWEGIIELPQASAQRTTLGELLEIARQALGPQAQLQIPAFVTRAICKGCKLDEPVDKPRYQLTFNDAHCRQCGELMEIITYDQVAGGEPILNLTLEQIGIPSLDIIPAKTPNWEYKYFELTGDADTFFSFS